MKNIKIQEDIDIDKQNELNQLRKDYDSVVKYTEVINRKHLKSLHPGVKVEDSQRLLLDEYGTSSVAFKDHDDPFLIYKGGIWSKDIKDVSIQFDYRFKFDYDPKPYRYNSNFSRESILSDLDYVKDLTDSMKAFVSNLHKDVVIKTFMIEAKSDNRYSYDICVVYPVSLIINQTNKLFKGINQ